MFCKLLDLIDELSTKDFAVASLEVVRFVDTCDHFSDVLIQIGTIPESIEHDSTQEKLFSKASDAVLARAFREMGLKATVLRERGDSADVQAESVYYGYTLVADAKAFRLSRTAKNQKDFKVTALSGWRKDADYAVLCSPYFQYPTTKSQIYAQAVGNNVCLLSWEHIRFFVENGIRENDKVNFAELWNISGTYANNCVVAESKKCFIPVVNKIVVDIAKKSDKEFRHFLNQCRSSLTKRADEEASFWKNEIAKISQYTKEQAIVELIKAKKIDEKISQIEKYIAGIKV